METKAMPTPTKEKAEKTKVMQDGIKAIIYLQSLAGIVETPAQATKGWLAMSDYGRQNTMDAYNILKK